MNAVLFDWLVERSWQAALLAVLIFATQFALAGRLPARWRQAMWLPLLGLLVFPALPESRVSVFNYVNDDRLIWQAPVAVEALPASFVPDAEPLPLSQAPMVRKTDWKRVARIVWMAGAAGLLALVVGANARFWWRLRRLPDVGDERLRGLLDVCRAELGMRRRVRMVQMPGREGPAVAGIFRPVLLLPAEFSATFTDREIRLVLLHELGHWQRGDVLVNALLAVLRALHWFNPVLWWAFRRMRLDRELACDEWVLARTGECRAYGETLLKLSTDFEPSGAAAGVAGIFENRDELKRRIRQIAGFSTNAGRWPLAGAALVFVLGATFLTRAVTKDVPVDPEVGKLVDRNGVLLAEYRREADGRLRAFHFPLGAFAAHLLYGLDDAALPQPGQVVYLTLDARVQAAAERALREVGRGAAVVLDPENGDILAMASVPSYDPNAFFPSISAEDWKALTDEEAAPLLNRAINGYTPGSIYKLVTALAGVRAGIGDREFECSGGVSYGSTYMKCWAFASGGHGAQDLEEALKQSCNAYFYQYANAAGIEQMVATGKLLGIGQLTGIPTYGENPGLLDGPENLAKVSPKETWRPGLTANVSIGMGQVLATPLQMASVTATVANGGTCYLPRLVGRVVREGEDREEPVRIRARLFENGISREGIERVRHGMWRVVNEEGGTARKARLEKPVMSGKTGTAQSWRFASDGTRAADNTGWFVGFAPYEHPRYAVCVAVQGAKAGGAVSAPLAARIVEEIESGGDAESVERFAPAAGSFAAVDSIPGPGE